ncbi:VOC family protein [Amycolatopsis sp. NPDC098790]|uniref:VOC family protein n=1 Tax=Amycolatopsis sp. NPDC098790 TaxID=3363939 RepID=UPI003828B0FA
MRVLPIRYTSDVEALQRFYTTLGLETGPTSRPGGWVELPADGGTLAVHKGDRPGRCELAFETDEPLEDVQERLQNAGYEPGPVIDEGFGRSLRIDDPDGVPVQINAYERDLYT